jgi:hypothetical protein
MHRWWGVGLPGTRAFRIRYTEGHPLRAYTDVVVRQTTAFDTWKTWRKGLFHVQAEGPDSELGPASPLRVRWIIQDEFTSQSQAEETAKTIRSELRVAR